MKELLAYNSWGIVPGPGENEKDFLERGRYCLNLEKEMSEKMVEEIPFSSANGTVMKEAFPVTKQIMDIAPKWVPYFYSNDQLSPWHGGSAWIFQVTPESPTASIFQLRKSFQKGDSRLYPRKEIVAHEMSHVGRMMFEEPQFEELLAYRTSTSSWRRWWGPLFSAPWQSSVFMILVMFVFVYDSMVVWLGHPSLYDTIIWNKGVLFLYLFVLTVQLWKRHRLMDRAKKNIAPLVSSVDAVIYRLTDKEITTFAKMSQSEIEEYMRARLSDGDLRWRVILEAYGLIS